jgi:DNA-binding transcriptional LysR family regulator
VEDSAVETIWKLAALVTEFMNMDARADIFAELRVDERRMFDLANERSQAEPRLDVPAMAGKRLAACPGALLRSGSMAHCSSELELGGGKMDQLLAIRTFVRVAEAGSMAKAAGYLDLPRSTVSKLLQDLEAHLGSKLLSRSTRATTLTHEGRDYYEKARILIDRLDEMDAEVSGRALVPSGRLRVDIGSSLANLILLPNLPEFLERYPEMEIVLGVADRAVDLIGEGVDCVIRGGALMDSSLIARRLGELKYVTCASPGYLDHRGVPETPEQLEKGHYVCGYFSASTGAAFPLRFRRGGEAIEIRPPRRLSVNESTAHMTALLSGAGIGQTFEFVARPYIANGRLIEVLSTVQPEPHPLYLVYPSNRHQSAKLRAFADWALSTFERVLRS